MIKTEIEELPDWITGYIGNCPHCNEGDLLIIVLRKRISGKQYLHCIKCNKDFDEGMNC